MKITIICCLVALSAVKANGYGLLGGSVLNGAYGNGYSYSYGSGGYRPGGYYSGYRPYGSGYYGYDNYRPSITGYDDIYRPGSYGGYRPNYIPGLDSSFGGGYSGYNGYSGYGGYNGYRGYDTYGTMYRPYYGRGYDYTYGTRYRPGYDYMGTNYIGSRPGYSGYSGYSSSNYQSGYTTARSTTTIYSDK